MVQRKRHLAKAVSYRCLGSIGPASAAYCVTGDVKVGVAIGAFDTFAKIGLYYLHERAWYRIRWGIRTDVASSGDLSDHPLPPNSGRAPASGPVH